ncbi:MAG: hypothetical protein II938_02965 [Alphaproteobacteria bacterium]|nr:hypothetical protein [Alphaproteobacteria bacterium]
MTTNRKSNVALTLSIINSVVLAYMLSGTPKNNDRPASENDGAKDNAGFIVDALIKATQEQPEYGAVKNVEKEEIAALTGNDKNYDDQIHIVFGPNPEDGMFVAGTGVDSRIGGDCLYTSIKRGKDTLVLGSCLPENSAKGYAYSIWADGIDFFYHFNDKGTLTCVQSYNKVTGECVLKWPHAALFVQGKDDAKQRMIPAKEADAYFNRVFDPNRTEFSDVMIALNNVLKKESERPVPQASMTSLGRD